VAGGFVASEAFREAYAAQASSLGFPASVCFVDHPIQDRTDTEMIELAERFSSQVQELLRTG